MITYRKFTIAAISAAAMAIFSPGARAQAFEEKLTVSFSAPVEVPGEVLPAGTYVFEALQGGRLTRILSVDEKHIYATLLTVPEEKEEPVEKPTINLDGPLAQGSPERVDSWFYPGESTGNQFIYQKVDLRKSLKPLTGAAKDIETSSEFLGAHAAHLAAKVGKALI